MTCDYQQLPHEGIRTLTPYIPGKSVEELAKEQGISDIIKLASNENPLGCSPGVSQALAAMPGTLVATYPAPLTHPLVKKLALKSGVEENMVVLSNGSDFLFSMLLTIFALQTSKQVLTHEYAFITFEIQAKTLGIPVKTVPLLKDWQVDIDALILACDPETALIFLANPNNPTGRLIAPDKLEQLLKNIPASTVVIIDEAYYEFACMNNNPTALTLLQKYPNLVITRTFSKAYGLAGLRLGYAIAQPPIIELLQRVQLPFLVNQAALTAGMAALEDELFLRQTLENNRLGLEQLRQGLDILRVPWRSSSGNFLLLWFGQDSMSIYQQLLTRGIIVRPLTAYGLSEYLRVSTGTPGQNTRFLATLGQIIQN